MNEDDLRINGYYTYNDSNTIASTTVGYDSSWTIAATPNIIYSYNVGGEVEDLKKEIKELRKRISQLSTLVCTHIGKEQLKEFNERNGK